MAFVVGVRAKAVLIGNKDVFFQVILPSHATLYNARTRTSRACGKPGLAAAA